jgi:hypothetical protein
MFEEELKNKYILENRMLKGKEIVNTWFPNNQEKINKLLGTYNLAILGSITDDVVSSCGLDTLEQLVELINKYSSKKIIKKTDIEKTKHKALILLKKWNPDNYDGFLHELTDQDLFKLGNCPDNIISAYGLNTLNDIKTCILLSENKSDNNMSIDFYNGNYNEFLFNTFISYRKIKQNEIDTDINVQDFDFEFFNKLMDNAIETYLLHIKKLNK